MVFSAPCGSEWWGVGGWGGVGVVGGWVDVGGGWVGVPQPCAPMHTHTHTHAHTGMHGKQDNFMQMAAPIGGIPAHVHMHVCECV